MDIPGLPEILIMTTYYTVTQSAHQSVTRHVGANGTFYIVKDEGRLVNGQDTHVEVAMSVDVTV